ncbi:hypothetical protein SETIT_9G059800v2 [Setaria italica]|uniref:Uncharacterized protein n=1 Tax=Setaria italica TaxID=4555 RepID=A0A368SDI0_SETIT|nr:hypothetical protein SETIT_9G059800v2 [Setaria italica]
MKNITRKQQRSMAAYLVVTAWNIWKKRNRRIFEQKALTPPQILQMIQDDIKLRQGACGT